MLIEIEIGSMESKRYLKNCESQEIPLRKHIFFFSRFSLESDGLEIRPRTIVKIKIEIEVFIKTVRTIF